MFAEARACRGVRESLCFLASSSNCSLYVSAPKAMERISTLLAKSPQRKTKTVFRQEVTEAANYFYDCVWLVFGAISST